jgi:repressor LexA
LRVAPDFEFPEDNESLLPLVGRIAAGLPIEALEDRETLDLQEVFDVPGEKFVLLVTGDSMIDEQIRDGDYVVCQRRNTARNGETVVALLEDGEATLKTFFKEKNRIRLQPANPAYKPIYTNKLDIQGVVIGVIRRM